MRGTLAWLSFARWKANGEHDHVFRMKGRMRGRRRANDGWASVPLACIVVHFFWPHFNTIIINFSPLLKDDPTLDCDLHLIKFKILFMCWLVETNPFLSNPCYFSIHNEEVLLIVTSNICILSYTIFQNYGISLPCMWQQIKNCYPHQLMHLKFVLHLTATECHFSNYINWMKERHQPKCVFMKMWYYYIN